MSSMMYRPIIAATILTMAIAGCQTAAPTLTHEGTVGNNVSKTQLGSSQQSGVVSQPMAISAAQGGRYVSSDGLINAQIPPGALSGDAQVTITRGDTSMFPVNGTMVPGILFHVDLGGATLNPGQSIVVNCKVDDRFVDGVKAHDPNFTPSKYNLTQSNGVWYMAMTVTANGPAANPNDAANNGWALQEDGNFPMPAYILKNLQAENASKYGVSNVAVSCLSLSGCGTGGTVGTGGTISTGGTTTTTTTTTSSSTSSSTATPTAAPAPTPTPCPTYAPVSISNTMLVENAQMSLNGLTWTASHEGNGWFTCHYGHTCGWGNVTNAIQEALAFRAYGQLKNLKNSFCGGMSIGSVQSQAAGIAAPLAGGPLAFSASSINSGADLDNLITKFQNWTTANPVHDPCNGHTVTVTTHTTFVSDDASLNGSPVTDGPIYFANQNNLNWYISELPDGTGKAVSNEADGTPLELIPTSWVSGLHQAIQGPDVKVGVSYSPLNPTGVVELTITKNSPHVYFDLTTDGAKLADANGNPLTAHVAYTLDGAAKTVDLPVQSLSNGDTQGSLYLKQDVNSDAVHTLELTSISFGDPQHPEIDSAGYTPAAQPIVRTQTYHIKVPLISVGAK